MRTRISGFLSLTIFSLALVGCLGSNPKDHGGRSLTNQTSSPREDTTDNFVLELAHRETTLAGTRNRAVTVQGRASTQANLFVNICGLDASKCTCTFFLSTNMSTGFTATSQSVNQDINTLSCQIPAGITDANLDELALETNLLLYLRITDSTGTVNSGQIRVKSKVTLADVIGSLPQGQVRKVYSYSCTRTFLEGSGISGGTIACADGMLLGALDADYQFYLYQQVDLSANNFNERGQEQYYNAGNGLLCGLQMRRLACNANNNLVYGLSAVSTDKFRIAVQLTSGPEPNGKFGFVGFAATTDSNLNCPPGLVKIRPYQAVPSTYTDQPSNFVNTSGALNDTRLELATTAQPNFTLRRHAPSGVACANQICSSPAAGTSNVQDIAYSALSPVLCAIPGELLNGI